MRLADIGKTFADVDLGAPDAEADKKLADYFVQTPYVDVALGLKRTLFLGRKGAGKSALFTQLPRLIANSVRIRTMVLNITPDQYAWGELLRYEEGGLLPEQAHANAWKFSIAVQIAVELTSLDYGVFDDVDERQAYERLKSFVSSNYQVKKPNIYDTARKILPGIKNLNFAAFGFSFGLGVKDGHQTHVHTPDFLNSIFCDIMWLCKNFSVVVALDKLDDSWDGSDRAKSLIIGLLKASKNINDEYSDRSLNSGINVLVFLRSDIYEGLRFDDKDKHRATEETITWTPDLLREMVDQRLPDGVTTNEIFESGDMRGSIAPFNYIVKRTFLRPREIIQFLQECIRQAGSGSSEIKKDDIRAAEIKYSAWKVDDLKQEYHKLFPDFDAALEALRQGKHRYNSTDELCEHLRRKVPQLAERTGAGQLVRLLFDASAIGVRIGNSGSPKFRSEEIDLVLPTSGNVYVHQGLHRGLKIVEQRQRSGK